MIGCKNKVLWFIYVLIYEDNFPVFSTCVEMILTAIKDVRIIGGILYVCRDDSLPIFSENPMTKYSLRV